MDSDEGKTALKIVATSGEQLVARLAFFRLTFGLGGLSGCKPPVAEAHDLAQATGFQNINNDIGNGNDENMSGEMYLFSPASTTFVKHFISRANTYHGANQSSILHLAGYGNTTTAVDSVRFQMSSGNFDQGVIKLYGIKDS